MSFTKSKLKLARDALDKKSYMKAKEAATEVLEYEADNYNAHVFLALSLLELGEVDKSEQAYRNAINIHPELALAWQGIGRLYERSGRWVQYLNTLYHLINHYNSQNDVVKCAENLQKLIDALSLLLPDSHLYPILSRLPEPDYSSPTTTTTISIQAAIYNSLPVLQELIALSESREEQLFTKEVESKRTRLGAPKLEQLRRIVGQEIWGSSRLPTLYTEVLNHPNSPDALRRETESKLLLYKYKYLCSLQNSDEKMRTLQEVDTLIESAILLQLPDEFAWTLSLETLDVESMSTDVHPLIQKFVDTFPNSAISAFFTNFLSYRGLSLDSDDGHFEHYNELLSTYPVPDKIFITRLMAELHLEVLDYENALKMAEKSLVSLDQIETVMGRRLSRTRTGIRVIQATCLVHLQAPKHHDLALKIINQVLSQSPCNIQCLMGKAFIEEAAEHWTEAARLFLNVASLLGEDPSDGLRSAEEAAWCQHKCGQHQQGLNSLQRILSLLENIQGREIDRARCLWRIGQCQWELDDCSREDAYRSFIASLKQNSAYAPAFTSLGIYYQEVSVPPDLSRASKCFQKAFELDAHEIEAAQRLAVGFAQDQEWDLVEVVARRTIEDDEGSDEKTKVHTHVKPTTAWAWKAIGVVELIRKNYGAAIQALQTALKSDRNDYQLWLRLGEAYGKAGRHLAALKALCQSQSLEPDDWMSLYLVAGVKYRDGQYQDAINTFSEILRKRPGEPVVLVPLIQSYMELGQRELSDGLLERAEKSFLNAIELLIKINQQYQSFRMVGWKLLADALFLLSSKARYIYEATVSDFLERIVQTLDLRDEDEIFSIIPQPHSEERRQLDGKQVLEVGLMVYYYRLSMRPPEVTVAGNCWYDLGIALHVWALRFSGLAHEKAINKSIDCLQRALREDGSNPSYWAALGTAYFSNDAKLAQHAYVRALEFDVKNVVTWTNLGLLYLDNEDFELAAESFKRAQVLDPDYATAWLGQAILFSTQKQEYKAAQILEHAVDLPVVKTEVDLEYSIEVYEHFRSENIKHVLKVQTLLPAFFSIQRYCRRRPDNAFAVHLFGLISECLGHIEVAENLMKGSISLLESAYEDAEDPVIERQFVIANANLARLQLSQRNWTGALTSFENVLGLLSEHTDATAMKLRIQAQYGSALAKILGGETEAAIEFYEAALLHTSDNDVLKNQIVVSFAQTLWELGNVEGKEAAKSQLLQCITLDPRNMAAVTMLAGMGVVTDDESLIDVAFTELLELSIEERQTLDPCDNMNYLLTHYYQGRGDDGKAVRFAQKALQMIPVEQNLRVRLAIFMLQQGKHPSSIALISSGPQSDVIKDPRLHVENLRLSAMIHGQNKDAVFALRAAQKATILSPADQRCWQTLAFVNSLTAR
ncbi:hypothetical protein AMATHDRAFT_2475 [Amanita thiersii Skay4041]|uniref:Superkiller protein 3 n=1 Tax=Amanita thiersii Skay4041 TaxID=703135 RepID=A0A2A9NW10_9AGAR|nr:hypothetical protein AMATHDRAFT_2475 [Amanita thiersii Skay4041]